jgi:hypothetical protein
MAVSAQWPLTSVMAIVVSPGLATDRITAITRITAREHRRLMLILL